jgi:hypothetical protein
VKVGDLVELSMKRWRLFRKEELRDPDKVGIVIHANPPYLFTVQWCTDHETVELRENIRHFKGVR